MGLRLLEIFLLSQRGNRLESSESDVYRRQILTTEVYSRAERVKDTDYHSQSSRKHDGDVHPVFG